MLRKVGGKVLIKGDKRGSDGGSGIVLKRKLLGQVSSVSYETHCDTSIFLRKKKMEYSKRVAETCAKRKESEKK